MIKLTDFEFQIDGKLLFNNVNLDLTKGQYQLIGSNGVGKTTLFEILTKQITKEVYGKIFIPDSVVYIAQKPLLLENLTVKDNILYFNNKKYDVIARELKEYNININSLVKELSGGQRQLVYLHILLNKHADLYLIDEPLNNLDNINTTKVVKLISLLESVIVIDHQNNFRFKRIKIEKRGVICEQ